MRTNIIYILSIISLFFLSCTSKLPSEFAIITGKVDVNWSNTIKLSNGAVTFIDPWIDRAYPGDSILNLNSDGTFKMKLPIERSDFYRLSHESNEIDLFISPNDSLHIEFESDSVFSGKGAIVNNHMNTLEKLLLSKKEYINSIDFYVQSSDSIKSILDSFDFIYLKTHKSFSETNTTNKIFEVKVLADMEYDSKRYQMLHPPIFMQETKKKLQVKETYFEDIAIGSFNNPEMLKSKEYILFLNEYMITCAAGDEYKYEIYYDAPIERIHPMYEQIQKLEAHPDIKDYLFYEHLNKSMDNYGVAYLQDLMPDFREDCKNVEFLKQIEDRFQSGLEKRKEPTEIKVYKTVGNIELEAHIFYPEDFKEGDQRPAYLFFHGGGWSIGIPEWGYKSCKNISSKGMIAISFEYRLLDIHQSNLLDCVRDAKSAIKWTREQAASLGVDPNKIVAAGFSAGAHLAACTAILNEYEDSHNTSVSSKPNAIIVQSASYNTLKNNWFNQNAEQKAESISTYHQLDKNLVPSIFFHGTNDHLARIDEFKEFKDKMDVLGIKYEYKIFENVGHFFNNAQAREKVKELTEEFLVDLGYIVD